MNPNALNDKNYRFFSTLVCLKVINNKVNITIIGDSGLRVNGKTYCTEMLVDDLTSNVRADYINKTGDIDGARDFLIPLLKNQLLYANNEKHPLGYGVIDGINVPNKFIKTYEFNLEDIDCLEFFTDGYMDTPKEIGSINAWEDIYEHIEKTDPDKCLKYKSTKTKDDRTILIAKKS